jgi:hypothetical protein
MHATVAKLLVLSLPVLLAAGCGGSPDEPTPIRDAADGSATDARGTPMPAPEAGASSREVHDYLVGDWSVNPLADVETIEPFLLPMQVTRAANDVFVTVSRVEATDVSLDVADDGSSWPTLTFTTGDLNTTGPTGEPMTVPGPTTWTGELYQGQLVGTATGPDGRSTRWVATKP